jgi:hypothetical protein
MGLERVFPLRFVLAVAPSGFVRSNIGFGNFGERDDLGCLQSLPSPLSAPRFNWVYPHHAACGARPAPARELPEGDRARVDQAACD